ncbi:MAG: protein kinase domain-containing protein [Terriglobales bacterium]
MPLAAGTRFGPYEIVAPLGAGGMGEVYRAHDAALKRDIALKVLPAALAQDGERRARFEREAQVLASLQHPNIAAIYGLQDNAIVMELAEGVNLAGPLPLDDVLALGRQIAAALEYAHERGIVHRDLKPANIKVTPDGQVKLLDFGLAKALAQETAAAELANSPTLTHAATMPGVILGTAAYMAPEQAKGKAVDRRADIWAFGCVLFELLAGAPPFPGETVTEVLAAVITQEPEWQRLPAATPAWLRSLLGRCLRKDPRQRLQAMGDARIALEETEKTSAAAAAGKPGRRWLPWAVAAAAVALAVAAWWTRRPAAALPALRFELTLPANLHLGYGLAFSPDGTRLVFVASDQGRESLWMRRLDQTTPEFLRGTDNAQFPFWSPDGHALAFFANGALKRLDLATGAVRTLCSVDAGGARGGSWSSQGVIVFSPGITEPLMRVPDTGGTPVPATSVDARSHGGHRWPLFLPDGQHFIFAAETNSSSPNELAIGRLGSTQSTPLLPLNQRSSSAAYADGYLLYSDNGALVVRPFDAAHLRLTGAAEVVAPGITPVGISGPTGYVALTVSNTGLLAYRGSDDQLSQLEMVDAAGKVLRQVTPPGAYFEPRLSPDGQRVVFGQPGHVPGTNDLWTLDLASGARARLTFEARDNYKPIWSADGRWIYYCASTTSAGVSSVYRKRSDGSQPAETLYRGDAFYATNSISQDGTRLILDTTAGPTGTDLVWLPVGAGGHATLSSYLRTPAREKNGALSPDGRWVAYQSNGNGEGDWEVFVSGFPDHQAQWQVSNGGGYWPEWSADGKTLYYYDGARLMAVSVTWGASPAFGPPRPLFAMQPAANLTEGSPDYSVLPGGRGFLINAFSAATPAPIVVASHWQNQ